MTMIRYRGVVRTNRAGSDCGFDFYAPDDISEDELDDIAQAEAMELVEWFYEPADEDDT